MHAVGRRAHPARQRLTAGLVAAALGAGWSVAVAVALLVAAVPVARRLPRQAREGRTAPAPASPTGARPSLLGELVRGVRAIVERRELLAVTLATMLSSAGFAGFVVASPLLGQRLAESAAAGTALLTALAVGSLIGAGALARRPRRGRPESLVVVTTTVLGAVFALLAAVDSFALAVGAAFAAGVAEGPQLAAVFQVRHREAPEALRSQLFTTAASLKMSAFALGSAIAGVLAVHSVSACLLGAAAAQGLAVAAVLAFTAPGRRRREARRAPA